MASYTKKTLKNLVINLENKVKVITFGNSKYKRLALNWLEYIKSHSIKRYTVYALDKNMYSFLKSCGVQTELIELDLFSGMDWDQWRWNLRFEQTLKILEEGEDIIHSDLDAIWLKNAALLLDDDYDIICSSGKMPFHIYQKYNFTLCMGWCYFKCNQKVINLFKEIIQENDKEHFDDQEAINFHLFEKNKIRPLRNFNNNAYEVRSNNLKVLILDQSIISRDDAFNKHTFVAHPPLHKLHNRENLLKNMNLWKYNG